MQNSSIRRFFILFASQFLLVAIYFLLLDFLYRRDSFLYQIDTLSIAGTLVVFAFLLGVAACGVSALLCAVALLVRKVRPSFLSLIENVTHFLIFALFAYINFTFLLLWIRKVLPAQHFDRDARIASVVAVAVLFFIFFALHYFVLRKPIQDRDTPRTIGVLIVPFVFLIAGSILASIVIEHHPGKTAFFQKYGLALFLIYYLLYRTKIHETLIARRLFVIPALIIFAVSFVGASAVVASARRLPEVEIATPLDQGEKKGDVQNIILVTFDGLSANRMSLYGNERPTTPVIDALGKESYVFDAMHAESDNTVQSISAMHTGMHYYGVDVPKYGAALAGGNTVGYMPRVFDALGWDSAYVWYGSNLHLGRGRIFTFIAQYNDMHDRFKRSRYGRKFNLLLERLTGYDVAFSPGWALSSLNQYFEKYVGWYERSRGIGPPQEPPERVAGPGSDSYAWALDYLNQRKSKNFFLWIHVWAPHQPYIRSGGPFLDDPNYSYEKAMTEIVWNSPPLDPKYEPIAKKLRLMSEEYIAGADDAFGRFLEILKASGLYDNTMLIVSADHGQAFEKGDMFHLTGVMYEQTAQIPLLIHMPGQTKGKRIKTSAQHTDLMPTILDTLGIVVPQWMEGESLWKYIEQEKNKPIERVTFSQAISEGLSFTKSDDTTAPFTFLVYKGDYKLIYRFYANRRFEEVEPPERAQSFIERYPQIELYNLADDPHEDDNLADIESAIRDELVALAQERIEKTRNTRAFK